MRCSFLFLFLVAASLFAQQSSVPEIRYRSVPDFLKLPTDLYFGEVAGVAVNSKRHVFVFSRGNTTSPAYGASAAQLLEFGADGTFVRSGVDQFGRHSYVSQGLSLIFRETVHSPTALHDSLPGMSKLVARARSEGRTKASPQFSECEYNGTAVETDEEAKMRYHDRPGPLSSGRHTTCRRY